MKTATMQFDKASIDLILDGLDELPHKRVRRFYDAVLQSAQGQFAAPEPGDVQAGETTAAQAPQRRLRAGRVKRKE